MKKKNITWWKWGNIDGDVHLSDFPKLKTYLEEKWQVKLNDDLLLPPNEELIEKSTFSLNNFKQIFSELDENIFSNTEINRLKYGYGKAYQDAIDILTKQEHKFPDFVLFPDNEKEISYILKIAAENNIDIITFSGGTNVTECLSISSEGKLVCALNMTKLDNLIELDKISLTATFQCGIYGPKLESILQKEGLTMGHFPQSFEFSTLGGWIATRSAGQESGKYGKIEDMVLGLKVITPNGTISHRDYPKHATGLDTFRLFLGSEGTLGIITQAKMKIYRIPKHDAWVVAIFKDFASGADSLRELIQTGIHPAICRLSDENETNLLSLLDSSKAAVGVKKLLQDIYKKRLAKKGYSNPCVLMMKFLDNHKISSSKLSLVKQTLKSKGAVILPAKISSNWESKRFSLPFLRETVIQHRILIDMFETSIYWKDLIPLYNRVKEDLNVKSDYFSKGGILFCHISHIYSSGASLYFTLLAPQEKGKEKQQWDNIKSIVTSSIYDMKGAISHHHSIGKAHGKWYNRQLNEQEKILLKTIKSKLDPNNILNPGKLYDES
jgi:alkyldihydroxyacetonephosphate synthase